MPNHSKKVVAITGASAGVGRATAVEFARQGATVALLARGMAGLEGAKADVEAAGGKAWVCALDVANSEAVENAVARIETELGPIDVWVNNAMTTVLAPVNEMSAAEYRRVTEVTYLGTLYSTCAVLRYMRQRNRGVIIQVGSALAYRAIPLQSAYCAAKFACRGFTDSLRVELQHDNSAIQLTTVHLSAFNTPQFDWARTTLKYKPQPLPPIFQPEVAARAIVWAAGQQRREVYVGFPAAKTIWINKFLPAVVDRVLQTEGYTGQQGEQLLPAGRPDNLFQPVDQDMGSHGRFDSEARSHSWQLWATMHRAAITTAVLLPAALLLLLKKR